MKLNLRQIILAIALIFVITLGFIPGIETATVVHAADVSGVCSNCGHMAWKLEGTTLTISKATNADSGNMCWVCPNAWKEQASFVEKVVIENSVTNIMDNAFHNYTNLESVEISNVFSMGNCVFDNCAKLKKITISGSIESIGTATFYGCSSLTEVNLPDTITSIGKLAFYDCTSLSNITIPQGVTSIGEQAFYNCKEIKEIKIPNGVTCIENMTFYNCKSLTKVTIPDSVTSIGMCAFKDCSSLKNLTIPDSVTDIGDYSLCGCSSLTSLTVPCGLKERITEGRIWDLSNPVMVITYTHSAKSCTANDTKDVLTATCACGEKTYTATLKAPSKTEYTCKPIVATCVNNIPGFTPVIEYTGNGLVDGKPVDAGTYTATLAYDESTSVSLKFTIKLAPAPAKPHKITNVVSGVHVYWTAVDGVSKYGLWRSENGANGTYKLVATPTVAHFTDTKVTSGKTYYYKVTTINSTYNVHSAKSAAIGTIYVGTPDITLRVNRAAGIGLGWDKIPGATGYAIYRKPYDGNAAWTRVATITDPNTVKWDDTGVKTENGTVYRYTIRALAGSNRTILSGCRNTGRTMVRLTSRDLNSATKVGATSIKCSWSTTTQATGYEVRFMVGNTVYKTYTIGNYKTGTKTFKDLKAGQTYKIQVRTYKKVDGVGSFYSAWSEAKYVKL